MSHILSDYGIKYVSTMYDEKAMKVPRGFVRPKSVGVEGGNIITLDRNNNLIPWYEISTDAESLPVTSGIFGCHWPNILHVDPSRHREVLDNWVRYFERCSNTYGIILSRDIGFAATQSLFWEYSDVSCENGRMTVDISRVPKTCGVLDRFYVSSRSEIKDHSGCELKLYEEKKGFLNYEVIPTQNIISLE
jgi:hypothetical protein